MLQGHFYCIELWEFVLMFVSIVGYKLKIWKTRTLKSLQDFKVYCFVLEDAFCNASWNYSLLLLPHGKLPIGIGTYVSVIWQLGIAPN